MKTFFIKLVVASWLTLTFTLICLFIMVGIAKADKLTLNAPQTEVSPIVTEVDWRNINLNIANRDNVMTLNYFLLNAVGQRIPMTNGNVRRTWICRNIADDPVTQVDETSTCWDDIFMFEIRTQDVGTPIGRGFRALIWNQMKNDPTVIDVGNDGTFDD